MLLCTRPWFPEVTHGGKQRERVCCGHLVNRGHPCLTARQGDPDNFRKVRFRHHRRAQFTPRQRVRNGVREEVVPLRIPTMPITSSDKPITDSGVCRSPWRSGGP